MSSISKQQSYFSPVLAFKIHCLHSIDIFFIFTVYAQVACALVMAGENVENHVEVKKILVEITIYFQIQVIHYAKRFSLICRIAMPKHTSVFS